MGSEVILDYSKSTSHLFHCTAEGSYYVLLQKGELFYLATNVTGYCINALGSVKSFPFQYLSESVLSSQSERKTWSKATTKS